MVQPAWTLLVHAPMNPYSRHINCDSALTGIVADDIFIREDRAVGNPSTLPDVVFRTSLLGLLRLGTGGLCASLLLRTPKVVSDYDTDNSGVDARCLSKKGRIVFQIDRCFGEKRIKYHRYSYNHEGTYNGNSENSSNFL